MGNSSKPVTNAGRDHYIPTRVNTLGQVIAASSYGLNSSKEDSLELWLPTIIGE